MIKGRYRIVRSIGRGAMGNVFEVVHEGLRTSFALKQLRADLEGEASIVARFRHEAEMMARLAHPNIARVFDIDSEPGFGTWMAMELINGPDLAARLHAQAPLPRGEALRIAEQVGFALECAHRAGLVHRDIKPSNVLIEEGTERAVLTDFGIAKHVGQATADVATRTGAFLGTYRYSSPEQIRNLRGVAIDGRADVYSLGVVLYEMVSGRKFLDGWSESEIVSRVGFAPDWKPPLAYDEPPPPALERLIRECVEPARERRLRTAGEVAARLAASRAEAPGPAARAAEPGPQAQPSGPIVPAAADPTAATLVPPPRARRDARTAVGLVRSASRVVRPGVAAARGRARRGSIAAAVLAVAAAALAVASLAGLPLDPRRLLEPAPPPSILSFAPDEKLVSVMRGGKSTWFSVVLDGLDPDRPPRMRWLLDDQVVAVDTTIWEYDPAMHRASLRKPGVLRFVVGSGRGPQESRTWWIQTTVPDLTPVLRSASYKPGSIIRARRGAVIHITVDAYDPDGDPLSFSWRLDGRPVGSNQPTVHVPVTRSHTVSLAISDGDATVWSTWDVRVLDAG